MDNIPIGELNITLPCEKCGSNELAVPCNATDGSAVTCSDCGTGLGSWGDVKAAIDKTTEERREASANFLGLSPLTAPILYHDIPKRLMRHRRPDYTKLKVCRAYERLKRRWQSLVDGTTAQSDSQSHKDATMTSHQNMMEHRESCEVCSKEDLALKVGELHEMLTAELN